MRCVRYAPLLLALCGAGAAPVCAQALRSPDDAILVWGHRSRAFDAPRLSDATLASMRGGLMLPNGLDISVGIDIQTRVDGLLALHTIYATDGPDAGVRVFTDGAGGATIAPGTVTVRTGADSGVPSITVSRSPTGTIVDPSTPSMPATVNLLSGLPATWLTAAGQTPVPVTENGPAVSTPAGGIRLTTDDRGSVVTLNAPMLEIQQLVGQATGVVVANSANDRVIDTVSSINLNLQGLSPELSAGLALADRLALDVAGAR